MSQVLLCAYQFTGLRWVAVVGEEISAAALAGADEVEQFALAVERFASVAIETKPSFGVFSVDAVVDA